MKTFYLKLKISYQRIKYFLTTVAVYSIAPLARASTTGGGGGMPWDSGLTAIQNALTGDIAHFVIIIMIASAGIAFAVGEQGGVQRKIAAIVFGGSMAVGAVSLYQTLSIGGAVV
jgi:type IV secretory pathway VirB2 component (pilin)